MQNQQCRSFAAYAALSLALAGCGGGGNSSSNIAPGPTPDPTPAVTPAPTPAPVAQASAQTCSAQNPYRNDATAPVRSGSLQSEKAWVRAYVDQAYLWYDQVPGVDATLAAYSEDTPANFYPSIEAYFQALKAPAKDRFSFTYSTKAWQSLSQSGVSSSHGIDFHLGSPTPPRGVRVAYVEPGSPGAAAGARRGDTLVSVDGIGVDDNTSAGIAVLNASLTGGDQAAHGFIFAREGANLAPMQIAGTQLTRNPVPDSFVLQRGQDKVGYLLFNEHVATAEAKLIEAVTGLRDAGVNELVLDLRYNTGGLVYIASGLAYMIAGPQRTQGKVFEKFNYNAKRIADNAKDPYPFFSTSTSKQPLPTLNLGRVLVLTSSSTCSASESIINGLEGVDVQVVRIGATTCGKPYGFSAKDNCGISYFPIEFSGVNAKGYGDYASGFAPTCRVEDDFAHALGDPAEGQLAAALAWRDTGVCPGASRSLGTRAKAAAEPALSLGGLVRDPVRTNAYLVDRP